MTTRTDPPRSRIGPYRVLRLLGRGGFGTVYLAQQSEPVRREVAVKVLNPGMDHVEIRARFEVERETLTMMRHPGISMLLDAGVTDEDEPYFVMEYVPGVPIQQYLEQHPLPLRERLALFRRVCDAVQHAHAKGVVHRDLTANNVLVHDLDGRPTPKIIDFGIAKSIGPDLAVSMHTTEGQAMGTPTYMSPEQARGDIAQIDTRTDIYTLGVQLYLLLTGTLPFTLEHLKAAGVRILQMICEDEPELPSQRVLTTDGTTSSHTLRGDLDWITARAMAKEPGERYASVAELSEDVQRYLDDEPVLAGPPTTWYRVSKLLRRHRGAVAAAAAILLSLVVGLVVSIHLYLQSSDNAERAESNLARYNQLSDVVLLETLLEDARELPAARPANRPALRAWLDRAEGLLARLPVLREALAEEDRANPPDSGSPPTFLQHELRALIADLEDFAGSPRSPLANVRGRLAWADEVEARTVDGPREAWATARAEVLADPRFDGFALEPVLGLVPLGPDPGTGLQEFLVPRTGTAPERDAEGRLRPTEASGLVLVLLPGGTFRLGSQNAEPELPQYVEEGRFNETRQVLEGGVWVQRLTPVTLAPFLVSKHELTIAQWARMTAGETPAEASQPHYAAYGVTPLCPVEQVSWARAREVLREFGLELPTEAQWEYACRAGSDAPWSCGFEPEALDEHANLADLTALDEGRDWQSAADADLRDGFTYSAPVGRYRPNDFGLHDVHGNVFELCLEPFGPYELDAFHGPAGERRTREADEELAHVIRGGGYRYGSNVARSAYRWKLQAGNVSPDVGLRPVLRCVE